MKDLINVLRRSNIKRREHSLISVDWQLSKICLSDSDSKIISDWCRFLTSPVSSEACPSKKSIVKSYCFVFFPTCSFWSKGQVIACWSFASLFFSSNCFGFKISTQHFPIKPLSRVHLSFSWTTVTQTVGPAVSFFGAALKEIVLFVRLSILYKSSRLCVFAQAVRWPTGSETAH